MRMRLRLCGAVGFGGRKPKPSEGVISSSVAGNGMPTLQAVKVG
jgi:hypothetical protein